MASKVFYRDFYGDIEKDAFLNLNNKYLEDDEILRHLDPLQVFITVLIILTCFLEKWTISQLKRQEEEN